MEQKLFSPGDILTAEKLNRIHDEAMKAQIKELKLLCDEKGKTWGAELCSPDGIKTTIPCVTVSMAPIDFTPTEG